MSEAREVRSFIGWNFYSLSVLSVWVAGQNSVPGKCHYVFATTVICYSALWGLEFYLYNSSFWYLVIVLS